MNSLAFVVPAYNEAAVLEAFQQRLAAVLDALAMDARVLYIDDGSADDTWRLLAQLAAAWPAPRAKRTQTISAARIVP